MDFCQDFSFYAGFLKTAWQIRIYRKYPGEIQLKKNKLHFKMKLEIYT